MGWRPALLLLVACLPGSPCSAAAPSPESGFDADLLQGRGLPPSVARYFTREQVFAAGWQPVQLTVNGVLLGGRQAFFDADGHLCFVPEFLATAGLLPMGDAAAAATGACPDYRRFEPGTAVLLKPSEATVDISVPAASLRSPAGAPRRDAGGIGALLNYRGYGLDFEAGGNAGSASRTRWRYLDTTLGINAGDWLIRSRQDYERSGAAGRWNWRGGFAQKTFEDRRQVLQAGGLVLQDPLFGGLSFVGAQWFPERALYGGNGGYPVTGLAPSRARVRILQQGVVLLDTVVPPGPFVLSNYTLVDRNHALEVEVAADSGGIQAFGVPSATLQLVADDTRFEGWNLAAGQLRDPSGLAAADGRPRAPLLAASHGWTLGRASGQAGGLVSSDYVSAATALNLRFEALRSHIGGQLLAAHAGARSGLLASVAAGRAVGGAWQLALSASLRGAGYRSVQERPEDAAGGARSQLAGSVSWNAAAAGAFSLGLSRDARPGGGGDTLNLAWSRSWPRGPSLSVGLARRQSRMSAPTSGEPGLQTAGTSFYAALSWPLGAGITSRSMLQRNDGVARQSTALEQQLHPQLGWRAAVDGGAGPPGSSLSVYGTPYFTTVSAGIARNGDSSTRDAEASGGVVATGDGVAFSPYPVQDSFATVRTGEVALTRLETPQGPVWSAFGLAAVPALTPYGESHIALAGSSVPLDVEVENGLQVVQAGRGAALRLHMGVRRVRRWMLEIHLGDGTVLPAGTAILRQRSDGPELVTVSDDAGRAMLVQKDEGESWSAELADGRHCTLRGIEARPAQPGDFFQRASALCE